MKFTNGELGVEPAYVPLTDKEIRAAAKGLLSGRVFGSWQLKEHELHLLTVIFLPLAFCDDLIRKEWERDNIAHFYGHTRDSVQTSVNGLPIFHTMRAITMGDVEAIVEKAAAFEEFMKNG